MKYKIIFSLFLISVVLWSCTSNDDTSITNNPFIQNTGFDTGNAINTNLPQYNKLQFAGNHIILDNTSFGAYPVVLYYSGADYSAFVIKDPNHRQSSCSNLVVDGIIATCSCDDDNAYDILTGQQLEGTTGQYGLVRYRVEVIGSIIRVFN